MSEPKPLTEVNYILDVPDYPEYHGHRCCIIEKEKDTASETYELYTVLVDNGEYFSAYSCELIQS